MHQDFHNEAGGEASEALGGGQIVPAPFAGPVVGIGASAGGLEALREMLARARPPTGMAFVIVQHLDPNHESMLAQLLDRQTELQVLQCEGGERIAGDTVYIIPPGRGLVIQNGVLELTKFVQPRGLRRPIDDFFLSLAVDQQANAACVILSGTGADGTTGLRAVKEHGGVCVVQQPDTARYDGMPLSAVGTGLVDFVQPPGEIVECLAAFFRRRGTDAGGEESGPVADHLDDLCRVLRTAVGHDFAGYKRTTLVRRVERRMHVLGLDSGRAYLARVRADQVECEALFRDLLINVTRFFRDTELFEILRERAVEPLLRTRNPDEDIRVWIPGCSSGEEAYSIAMLFADAARRLDVPLAVQIFATDIDERMLQIAREASYPAAALADIPAPLRERYVVLHAERFTIAAEIRDLIRFSSHSLVKDPPFSRVDLLSCRNLLIYFDERLQQSVVPLFHYAVRPGGYLFLGPSESVSRFEQLFPTIDQHARLFERPPGAPHYPIDLPGSARRGEPRPGGREERRGDPSIADETVAVRRVVERYAPPSMVLNEDGGIIAAYGRLSRYFDFPVTRTGGTSAITLARPGLRDVIGPLLRQTRDARKRVVVRDVAIRSDYGTQTVELVCDPLPDGAMLLILRETGTFQPSDDLDLVEMDAGDDHVEALEDELLRTRYKLRSAVEELETTNEELKSSNEEMMSMNEELQSTNEELSTVNDELKTKVEQLTIANADLRNFFESTDLAVIVLDRDLRVRSFTAAATTIFPLQPGDRGRPLADVASRLAGQDYLHDAQEVCAGGSVIQRRITTRDGNRTLSLRVLPYRLQNGSIDGATLVLTDITEALSLERQLAAERERLELAVKAGGIGVWEYSPDAGTILVDSTAGTMFGLAPDTPHPTATLIACVTPEDRPGLEAALSQAAHGLDEFEARIRIRRAEQTLRHVRSYGRLTRGGDRKRIVGVCIDVSPEYALAETRDLMLREMNHRVKNLFAIIGGMISAGARTHRDIGIFASDMRDRISALGRAHSLADPSDGQGMSDLSGLVGATLRPYRDHVPTTIEGPLMTINWRHVSSLAMILHEWATNSVKYGALGSEDGSLSVTWERKDGLVLEWRERMARIPEPRPGRGFGTLLVDMSLRQLEATVTRSHDASEYRITLHLPEAALART
ncbi:MULTISPECIES: chemotaxis protein CheB [Methylobacterium]|uniref:Blue-light-activated histidine kinase n=1 Tax=Methylobacterium longum TaxID=767694 RepID=A0ABT8AZ07_9HYPH|nr:MULTISPECIES: chemotaxis protein CheB [Methylobacterium]MCJ2097565.1 PAS domain-containing protein [Methylobacterium sp. E-046]MDN3574842.1 CheR family methyltransferase [Methylobacterium longum]GJE13882.1 Protein-glutamate methylesterase/protein-glutamine glutaminase [Methylobacterium longum]